MNKKLSRFIFVLSFSFLLFGSFLYQNIAVAEEPLVNAKLTPVITSIEPMNNVVGGDVVITGKNFERLEYVLFNNTKATITDSTGTRIRVTVPQGATSGKITIMNLSNLSRVSSVNFIVDNPILGKPTISSSPDLTSVKLVASGNLTPGDYHFSVYEEAGYPKNRTDFKPAADPRTSTITGSIASVAVTISGLKPSTRYVGVLYKDKYDDISETRFETNSDLNSGMENIAIENMTANSVDVVVSGLDKTGSYNIHLVGDMNKTPYDKTYNQTLKADFVVGGGDRRMFSGLSSGNNYMAYLTKNNNASSFIARKSFVFGSSSSSTPPPASSSNTTAPKEKSIYTGIVPECNTGEIDKETGQYKNACDFNYFMELINKLIKFLLFTIATPLVALILMYTGYLYITAGGSAGQTEKAKHIIFNAVVGYIIALAAWLVINTIVTSLLPKETDIPSFLDNSSLKK